MDKPETVMTFNFQFLLQHCTFVLCQCINVLACIVFMQQLSEIR